MGLCECSVRKAQGPVRRRGPRVLQVSLSTLDSQEGSVSLSLSLFLLSRAVETETRRMAPSRGTTPAPLSGGQPLRPQSRKRKKQTKTARFFEPPGPARDLPAPAAGPLPGRLQTCHNLWEGDENLRKPMEICGNLWEPLGILGVLWVRCLWLDHVFHYPPAH